ncbi:MAG TPA: hypothetical protein VIF62_11165 [Labilithrix sp.]
MQSLVVALALAVFGAGCAAQTSTDTSDVDESSIIQGNPDSIGEPGHKASQTGEQQVNQFLKPDTEVQGPVPDPWIGAGPVPDPWTPGDPGHPKAHLVAAGGTGGSSSSNGSNNGKHE